MAALKNLKHERFCQYAVMGEHSVEESLILAGYSKKSAITNSTKISGRPDVQRRLAELKGKVEEKTIMTVAQRRNMLDAIALKNFKSENGDHRISIQAIAEANRMTEGALVAHKQVNVNLNKELEEMSDIDLEEKINSLLGSAELNEDE